MNYDEFSPSRITSEALVKQLGKSSAFLDSNSSLSSPKGDGKKQQYFLDKSSFLKNVSPDRDSGTKKAQTNSLTLDGKPQPLQNVSDRRPKKHDLSALEPHARINLKVLDKLLKEKLKNELSKRDAPKKGKPEKRKARNAKGSQVASGANLQRLAEYKKQRSKSCMNQTDNIFGSVPKSKERQHVIQMLQQHPEPPKALQEKQEAKPAVKAKRKDKSSLIELRELKRLCLEELKKEILEGKIESLPNTSSAVNATNKRVFNMAGIPQKQDSKLNNSQQNHSKGDLDTGKRPETSSHNTILNPALSSQIKKYMERKKKGPALPRTLEQTAHQDKKLKIQENLEQLFKGIKSKQAQHLRH